MTDDELLMVEADAVIEHWGGDAIALANADQHEVAAVGRRAAAAAAWAEGFDAADINTPRSRKGHWEDDRPRKGLRTWIPDPLPTNPYRVSPEGTA